MNASLNEEENVEMVIDAAGKVRSAKVLGTPDEELVKAASGWKFIPAFPRSPPGRLRLDSEREVLLLAAIFTGK